MSSSSNSAKATCKECGRAFDTERGLKQHISKTHASNPSSHASAPSSAFTCDECKQTFDTERGLNIHVAKTHATSQLPATNNTIKKPANAATARKPEAATVDDATVNKLADRFAAQPCLSHPDAKSTIKASSAAPEGKPLTMGFKSPVENSAQNSFPAGYCNICNKQYKGEAGLKIHVSRMHGAAAHDGAADGGKVMKETAAAAASAASERSAKTTAHHVGNAAAKQRDVDNVCHFCGFPTASLADLRHHYTETHKKQNRKLTREAGGSGERKSKEQPRSSKSRSDKMAAANDVSDDNDDDGCDDTDDVVARDNKLKPDLKQSHSAALDIKHEMERLNFALNNHPDSPVKWKRLNTGSQFEHTKIRETNEFDIMFFCRFPDVVVEYSGKPGYYRVRWTSEVPEKFRSLTCCKNGKQFVDPKLFKELFAQLVKSSRRNLTLSDAHTDLSPGVCVTIKVVNYRESTKSSVDVDLTPALKFDEWPEEADTKRPKWILSDLWKSVQQNFYLVPKSHHSEYDMPSGNCTLWRASFSEAEKKMMRAADYSARKSEDIKTYRKGLVRLLKDDLEHWRKDSGGVDVIPNVSSYVMKTVALHAFAEFDKDKQWNEDQLTQRHLDALYDLYYCMSSDGGKPELEHYFLSDYNVLENLLNRPGGRQECKVMCQKVREKIKELEA